MKILCFQVQPKRSRGIDLGAVAALMARIAMSSDVREFTIRRNRGKDPWVSFLFTSASVARTWSRLESGAIRPSVWASAASVVDRHVPGFARMGQLPVAASLR